ncbi:MAG: 7-cyano-7-deazaguanine synthase [Candidatus Paceibacterota bacterium]|jgi:tRNA(Ile)-lysidine synthase TilS/MesJ
MQKIECKKCVNNNANPSITFDSEGLCNVCVLYQKNFNREKLKKELGFVKEFMGKKGDQGFDAMVGISGGKDSTATLYTLRKMGFSPLAFTFDTGYYPKHEFGRAKCVADKLGVEYEKIDIRKYVRKIDRQCYKLMADLYDKKVSPELADEFRKLYKENRKHYSIKCKHVIPFVRTCQLCRRTVIRAYYAEAIKHGVRLIVLGVNEWAGLSRVNAGQSGYLSAIRQLKPYKNKPAVFVVHLPFLLQRKMSDTRKILKKISWKAPKSEGLVESNSNSCLLGLAAESKAKMLLGFHPDSTRLAREVTVGFLTKKEAKIALAKTHKTKLTVRGVLSKAGLI